MLSTIKFLTLSTILVCWMGICGNNICAQAISIGPYLPLDTNGFFRQLARIEHDAFLPEDTKTASIFSRHYRERTQYLKQLITEQQLVFNPVVTDYLSNILGEIIIANDLGSEPLVVISRTPVVNAASLGNNLFIVYIGLLHALSTEEEIAFVLAHELAHDQLEHTRQHIFARANSELMGKGSRRTKRTLRRENYNSLRVNHKLAEREAAYLQRRHSRNNEFQADSLAIVYLKHTKYSLVNAIEALSHLETDNLLDFPAELIAKHLDPSAYPFNAAWVKPKATLFGGNFGGTSSERSGNEADFWIKDSLRTHPDIEIRRSTALGLIRSLETTTPAEPAGHDLSHWARAEAMAIFQRSGLPVQTLCLAFSQIAEQGETKELRLVIANSLFDIVKSIDEYTFDETVPPPTYFDHAGGQTIARMLSRMSRSEMQKLLLAYLAESVQRFKEDVALDRLFTVTQNYFNP